MSYLDDFKKWENTHKLKEAATKRQLKTKKDRLLDIRLNLSDMIVEIDELLKEETKK